MQEEYLPGLFFLPVVRQRTLPHLQKESFAGEGKKDRPEEFVTTVTK
jgi:hypothetical protein